MQRKVSGEATSRSAARIWPPLARFIGWEAALGEAAEAKGRTAHFVYEFVRFGVKQAWACLFGALLLALLIATHFFYPKGAVLARYDFLVVAAVLIQVLMFGFKLETIEKRKSSSFSTSSARRWRSSRRPSGPGFIRRRVCSASAACRFYRFHVCRDRLIHRAMLAAVRFRFTRHPPVWALGLLSAAIYANFFAHHYVWDFRPVLFLAAAVLIGPCTIYYKIWKTHRHMPLLVGLFLVALFIWFAENIGTFTAAWEYPHQRHGWEMVGFGKLGSWFLLMLISYTLVAWAQSSRCNKYRRISSI